jgi:hypothetical protein
VSLPTFTSGSSTAFDLSTTLPSGVVSGGTFSVDPNGAPLPTGMTLSSKGILSVGTAVATSVGGVVFVYAEP